MRMKEIAIATLLVTLFLLSGLPSEVVAAGEPFDVIDNTQPTPAPPPVNPGAEIFYDDGIADWAIVAGGPGVMVAVQFTPPFPCAIVTGLRFYLAGYPVAPLKVHVLDSTFAEIITPLWIWVSEDDWNVVDLSSYNIVVTGDFFLVLEWLEAYTSPVGLDTYDTSPVSGRSWWYTTSDGWNEWPYPTLPDGDFLIRAVVEPVEATIESCTSDGTPKDVFMPGEPVYAKGSGFDPILPVLIYVVPNGGPYTAADSLYPLGFPAIVDLDGNVPLTHIGSYPAGEYDIWVDREPFDGDLNLYEPVDTFGLDYGFFVVPEYPLGTILGLVMCLAALAVFKSKNLRIPL